MQTEVRNLESMTTKETYEKTMLEGKNQDELEILDTTNVFVKYLPGDMDDAGLESLFSPFGNIISAKVMLDPRTWTSLGFGFVKFSTQEEANLAINEMAGFRIQNKILLCKLSNISNFHLPSPNLYIKPLPPTCTEEMLDEIFGKYGDIETIKIVRDPTKSKDVIGLVKYAQLENAVKALNETHGAEVLPDWRTLIVKYAESDAERLQRKSNFSPSSPRRPARRNSQPPPLANYAPSQFTNPAQNGNFSPKNLTPTARRHSQPPPLAIYTPNQFTNPAQNGNFSPRNLPQNIPPAPLSPIRPPQFANPAQNGNFSPRGLPQNSPPLSPVYHTQNFAYAVHVGFEYMCLDFQQQQYVPLVFYPVAQDPVGWYNSYHNVVFPSYIAS